MHAQLIIWTLRRRPWRNLLIMVSVAMTVAVMIAFFSTRIELSRFFARLDSIPYQRFWVKPRNLAAGSGQYPLALDKTLRDVPGVKEVLYVNYITGTTPDGARIRGQGGSDAILAVERDFFPVDDASMQRWASDRSGAIVEGSLADKLHLEVGKLAEISTPKGPLKFTVSGISRATVFQNRVMWHYDYIDQFLGKKGTVQEYRIALDRATDSRPVVEAVDKILDERGLSAQMVDEKTMMAVVGAGQAGLIPNLFGALGLVLLITTALALTNTTVISVRERRAELASLRVLGFKKRTVAFMIVNEMFIVCLVGGILGSALAWFVMRDGISLGLGLLQAVKMTRVGLLAGLATAIFVPLIGSIVSSWLAVRAPLAEALRD